MVTRGCLTASCVHWPGHASEDAELQPTITRTKLGPDHRILRSDLQISAAGEKLPATVLSALNLESDEINKESLNCGDADLI